MLGGYLVLPVRSVHSSFLFSSWLTHLFSLRTLQLLHKNLDRDKVPLLPPLFEVYISFSHSLFREIVVHEKSLQKPVQIIVHLKNSQPWSSQNKIIHFQIPLFSLLLFLTWNSTRTHHRVDKVWDLTLPVLPYPHPPFKSPPLQYLEQMLKGKLSNCQIVPLLKGNLGTCQIGAFS
jgi:hypothetical protein